MNVNSFYGGKQRTKLPPAVTVFPIQNPDLSEDSDLSGDSDEEFIPSETEEEILLDSESDSSDEDQIDKTDGNNRQQQQQQTTTQQPSKPKTKPCVEGKKT